MQDLPQQSQALGLHVVPTRPVRLVTVPGTPGPAAPGTARQQSSAAQPPSGRPARPRRGQSARVLHNPAYAVLLDRDLHRHGPRSSPDLAQKRAHTSSPYGLLVPQQPPPTPLYQRKLTSTSPKTHQGVMSQGRRRAAPGAGCAPGWSEPDTHRNRPSTRAPTTGKSGFAV